MDLSTFTTITPLTIDHAHGPDVEATIHKIQQRLADPTPPQHIYHDSLVVTPGSHIVADSFEKYLGYDALQSSHLKAARKSALHYAFSKSDDKKELEKLSPEKTYFEIGTYLHQCILEPTKFSRAVIEPKENTASKIGCLGLIDFWHKYVPDVVVKSAYEYITKVCKLSLHERFLLKQNRSFKDLYPDNSADIKALSHEALKYYVYFLRTNSDYESVSAVDYEKIKILKLHTDHYGVSPHTPHGIIRRLLHHAKRETSFYTHDFEPGTPIKVRPDALQFKENIGVDAIISIKSSACEDVAAFERYAATNHYDLAEALYQDVISHVTGRKFHTTITIMLQTIEPYAIAVLIWKRDDIDRGRQKYSSALITAQLADSTGIYPGYESLADNPLGIIELVMPKWNNLEDKSKW